MKIITQGVPTGGKILPKPSSSTGGPSRVIVTTVPSSFAMVTKTGKLPLELPTQTLKSM